MIDSTGDDTEERIEAAKKIKKIKKTIGLNSAIIIAGIGLIIYFNRQEILKLNYKVNDDTHKYELENTVSYDQLTDYDVMTLDVLGKTMYVIGKNHNVGCEYTNILNGQNVEYTTPAHDEQESKPELTSSEEIEQYLVLFDDMQAYYTAEDLQKLYEQICTYKEEQAKTLTK